MRKFTESKSNNCIFCSIANGNAKSTIIKEWDDCIAIVPLGPVVPGHILVIPKNHVDDFTDNPDITANAMRRASELAKSIGGEFNLITSKGENATQSVFHLHIHLVPRNENDGLKLPWSNQIKD